MARNPLARLAELGQSVWCDDISRDFLLAGKLQALIDEDGVSGLTSNPTIFHKAIAGGTEYDGAIRDLASSGMSTIEIIEALMIEDIALAADQLRPVFESTGSRDGWVSIEVAPALAYDTQGTVAEALRVRASVGRPNVFIKVPATREGVAAIQDLTARGCAVNVTLIFSLERYREVMEAYLTGLEALQARLEAGDDLPALSAVRSVASFFVSRVDTAVDKRLEKLLGGGGEGPETRWQASASLSGLRGKAAVANARCAYRSFREVFAGGRWESLASKGACLQRPLWASTSTKDPSYSDIIYVQELIGPDTVNTMPLATMDRFRDHGEAVVTLTAGVEEAAEHLRTLQAVGVDMQEITAELEREGVKAFADSFEALVATVEQKRSELEGAGPSS